MAGLSRRGGRSEAATESRPGGFGQRGSGDTPQKHKVSGERGLRLSVLSRGLCALQALLIVTWPVLGGGRAKGRGCEASAHVEGEAGGCAPWRGRPVVTPSELRRALEAAALSAGPGAAPGGSAAGR